MNPSSSPTSRRVLVLASCAGGLSALGLNTPAFALAGPNVDENDPKALAVGYRKDAEKVDKAKYPSYAAGQKCGACSTFQGSPGIAAGPCPRMPKPVMAAGWCSEFKKKG